MPGPDCRIFLGKSGSGKTTLALHQLRSASRVLIHDPTGQPALAKGAIVATDRRRLVDLVSIPGPIRICWRGYASDDPREAFEWANRCALAGQGFAVLWDEVDFAVGSQRLPDAAYRIVNAGRHRGLRVFACSRRPFRVPRDLTAAATRICAFRITGPTDADYLRPFLGPAADRLPELPAYTCIDWTDDGAAERKSPFE